jgi:hypothetical protein
VQGSQLCYRPPLDWTGTTSFSFHATDLGASSVVGNATVTIEPYFYKAVNINGPNLVVGGHTFDSGSSAGISAFAAPGSDNSLVPGGASGSLATMLQTWMQWNGGSNGMRIGIGGVGAGDVGTYTAYVYVVEDGSTPQTYDVFLRDDDQFFARVTNDYNSGARGNWRKLGPYTVRITSYDAGKGYASFWLRGGTAKVAGIELWRGGDTTNWTSGDLGGYDTVEGSFSGGGNAVTLTGYGLDFWGTADNGHFAWFAEQGDVEIFARVQWNGTPPDQWSKAGVMIREWDDERSSMVDVVLTRNNDIAMQYRAGQGASAGPGSGMRSAGITETNPQWVRVTRVGNVFTGYYSTVSGTPADSDWIQLGQITIGMSNNYLIGVALTSHNVGLPATANFTNITIRPFAP